MNNLDKYIVNVNQIGPVHFNVEIITPDNLKFFNNGIQCHPQQLNKELLVKHLVSKETRNNWILDVDAQVTRITKDEIVKENQDKEDIIDIKEVNEIKLIPAETGEVLNIGLKN